MRRDVPTHGPSCLRRGAASTRFQSGAPRGMMWAAPLAGARRSTSQRAYTLIQRNHLLQSILCAAALLVAACAGGDLDELTPDQGRITRPDLGGEDPDLGGGGMDLGAPDQAQPGEDQGAGGVCSPLAKDCPADKKCVLDSNAQAFCMQRGVDRPAGDPQPPLGRGRGAGPARPERDPEPG